MKKKISDDDILSYINNVKDYDYEDKIKEVIYDIKDNKIIDNIITYDFKEQTLTIKDKIMNIINNNKYLLYIKNFIIKNITNWLYWSYFMHILYFIGLIKSTYQIAIFTVFINFAIILKKFYDKKVKEISIMTTIVKLFIPFVIFRYKDKSVNNILIITLILYIIINHKFLYNLMNYR